MFKRIDHVEIVARDYEKSIAFYRDILGFTVGERQKIDHPPLEEIVYLELGGTVIELMMVSNPGSGPADRWRVGYRMMAIEVDDMDRAVGYLQGKGVEISQPPMATGKSKRAEITDPNGLSIELRQW